MSSVKLEKTLDQKAPESPTQPVAPLALDELNSRLVFRDTVYTSRTLILPSGRALPVAKGRVVAVDDEALAFLQSHPDCEPVLE